MDAWGCRRIVTAFAVVLCVALATQTTAASQVTLAWDPPTQNTDGTTLEDLQGYVLSYGTASGSYDTTVDVGNTTTREVTGLTDGQVYYAAVKAYNSLGNQSEYGAEISWTAPDQTAPTISAPAQVSLVGNENDQAAIPDMSTVVTVSDNISDPAAIALTQDPTAGTLVGLGSTMVTVTATDEAGNTAEVVVEVYVTAMNRPPEVSAGADQTIRLPDDTVTLAATVSDDGLPEGETLSVQWTLVEGPASAAIATPNATGTTVTFTEPGTYILRVTANDGELTTSDDVTIVVNPEPVPLPPDNLRVVL